MIRELLTGGRALTPQPATRDPFLNLRRAMGRLFEDFSGPFDDLSSESWLAPVSGFSPRLDLEEGDDKIVLSAEVPGLTDKDIQVEVASNYLNIRGEKKSDREDKQGGRYRSERTYGSFERTISLPPTINLDKIEASVKDGVLKVVLPKTAESKENIKKIPVHH